MLAPAPASGRLTRTSRRGAVSRPEALLHSVGCDRAPLQLARAPCKRARPYSPDVRAGYAALPADGGRAARPSRRARSGSCHGTSPAPRAACTRVSWQTPGRVAPAYARHRSSVVQVARLPRPRSLSRLPRPFPMHLHAFAATNRLLAVTPTVCRRPRSSAPEHTTPALPSPLRSPHPCAARPLYLCPNKAYHNIHVLYVRHSTMYIEACKVERPHFFSFVVHISQGAGCTATGAGRVGYRPYHIRNA